MVESTAVSCIQSSHPDKNNNSVDRIISKEEEREDPRRELQSSSNTVVFPHSYKNYSVSTRNPATPNNSAYRINSSPRNTTTTRLTTRHLPATVPRASKHSTRQNPAIRLPTAFQGSIQYKQAPSNSTRQKQHSTRQPASTQSLQVAPRRIPTRILPGEIGFFPKGLSIVYPIQY